MSKCYVNLINKYTYHGGLSCDSRVTSMSLNLSNIVSYTEHEYWQTLSYGTDVEETPQSPTMKIRSSNSCLRKQEGIRHTHSSSKYKRFSLWLFSSATTISDTPQAAMFDTWSHFLQKFSIKAKVLLYYVTKPSQITEKALLCFTFPYTSIAFPSDKCSVSTRIG